MEPFGRIDHHIGSELSAATGIVSSLAIGLALWLALMDVWLFLH